MVFDDLNFVVAEDYFHTSVGGALKAGSPVLKGPIEVDMWFATPTVGGDEQNDGTYMRGELGAVEVTLRAYVGVSVKSFSDRSATAKDEGAFAGGGRCS